MHTYSHVFFTWIITRQAKRSEPCTATWASAGASLPDLPSILGAACLWNRRSSMTGDEFCEAIYSRGLFGRPAVILHSLTPVGLSLALYRLFRLEERDSSRALLAFLLGWAGHNLVDFLTHAEDARPVLWPLSRWRWESPVSYWDNKHHALGFTLIEHGAILLAAYCLFKRRGKGA